MIVKTIITSNLRSTQCHVLEAHNYTTQSEMSSHKSNDNAIAYHMHTVKRKHFVIIKICCLRNLSYSLGFKQYDAPVMEKKQQSSIVSFIV
jgi:hypothetical protein